MHSQVTSFYLSSLWKDNNIPVTTTTTERDFTSDGCGIDYHLFNTIVSLLSRATSFGSYCGKFHTINNKRKGSTVIHY